MVPFFQVCPIKQILALFPFSASAFYRANWINNAAIIVCVLVWMSECGLYACQNIIVCVHVRDGKVPVYIIFQTVRYHNLV